MQKNKDYEGKILNFLLSFYFRRKFYARLRRISNDKENQEFMIRLDKNGNHSSACRSAYSAKK